MRINIYFFYLMRNVAQCETRITTKINGSNA